MAWWSTSLLLRWTKPEKRHRALQDLLSAAENMLENEPQHFGEIKQHSTGLSGFVSASDIALLFSLGLTSLHFRSAASLGASSARTLLHGAAPRQARLGMPPARHLPAADPGALCFFVPVVITVAISQSVFFSSTEKTAQFSVHKL